jgi:hypothetical protein
VAKDKSGNITSTTPEGMSVCKTCGLPFPSGAKPAHDNKSSHRAAIAYAKGEGEDQGASAATGGATASGAPA